MGVLVSTANRALPPIILILGIFIDNMVAVATKVSPVVITSSTNNTGLLPRALLNSLFASCDLKCILKWLFDWLLESYELLEVFSARTFIYWFRSICCSPVFSESIFAYSLGSTLVALAPFLEGRFKRIVSEVGVVTS